MRFGAAVESPIDPFNRPHHRGDFGLRIPPSQTAMKEFFARWREQLPYVRKYAVACRDYVWEPELAGDSWGEGYYLGLLPRVVAELDPTRPYAAGGRRPSSTTTTSWPSPGTPSPRNWASRCRATSPCSPGTTHSCAS